MASVPCATIPPPNMLTRTNKRANIDIQSIHSYNLLDSTVFPIFRHEEVVPFDINPLSS